MIEALDAAAFPVDPLVETFDTAGPLRDAHCTRERGRITADHRVEAALLGGLSYSLALARNAARYVLTFETPGRERLETRVAMHRAAVRAAIAALHDRS